MDLQKSVERGLMEGEVDAFDFILAERLSMTLKQIGEMSNREYLHWRAYFTYRKAMQEYAAK